MLTGDGTGTTRDIGPTNRGLYLQDKPTAGASTTIIRGNQAVELESNRRFFGE